jgi:choline dehydrogenase-like flavoprotein
MSVAQVDTAGRVYDAIIVGSGAGGSAAAYKLARAGLDVLLLEKGPDLPRDGSTLDVRAVVHEGRFKSRESWRDGRGTALEPEEYFNLGGKTRWYGAALLRFAADEFVADEPHQCRAWPIRHDDMQRHYEEAEQMLGVREFDCEPGLAQILDRLESAGLGWRAAALPLGLNPAILADAHESQHFDGFASPQGLKGDAVRAFLEPVRGVENLTVRTGECVVALEPSLGSTTRVAGVVTARGEHLRARHVLLAAGALHSPRLLQAYVDTHGLGRRLPASRHVGRNLKLHLLTAVVGLGTRRQVDRLRKTRLLTRDALPHSSVQPLGFDGELSAGLRPRLLPRSRARLLGDRAYGFFLQTEDGSHPDNRVVAAVPDGRPTLDYDARRTPAALDEHRRLVRSFMRGLARTGLVPVSRRIGLAGTAHACGTLIAGNDPRDSVVDSNGRVHGLDGLYVVDGSVLPRSSRVNPSLSIYGWSLRVAERLAAQSRAEGDVASDTDDAIARRREASAS